MQRFRITYDTFFESRHLLCKEIQLDDMYYALITVIFHPTPSNFIAILIKIIVFNLIFLLWEWRHFMCGMQLGAKFVEIWGFRPLLILGEAL